MKPPDDVCLPIEEEASRLYYEHLNKPIYITRVMGTVGEDQEGDPVFGTHDFKQPVKAVVRLTGAESLHSWRGWATGEYLMRSFWNVDLVDDCEEVEQVLESMSDFHIPAVCIHEKGHREPVPEWFLDPDLITIITPTNVSDFAPQKRVIEVPDDGYYW